MPFLAIFIMTAGYLLVFSAIRGMNPKDLLRSILRGEALPGTAYPIAAQLPPRAVGGRDDQGDAPGSSGGMAQSGASFARPLGAWKVVSPYGMRWGRMHEGVDLAASSGTPILAAAAGVVDAVGWSGGAGNRVRIKHNATYTTKYFHMSRFANIKVGQRISQGQVIGYVGSTGNSSGPHLHFEVWKNGASQDPQRYVR
jgi:murein DD-endopeptidase MepM/ murein hydrolase activator NlpD